MGERDHKWLGHVAPACPQPHPLFPGRCTVTKIYPMSQDVREIKRGENKRKKTESFEKGVWERERDREKVRERERMCVRECEKVCVRERECV